MSSAVNQSLGMFEKQEEYRRLRTKLMLYFERRNCWTADDLADECLTRLVGYISPSGKSSIFDGNINALAFGIARKVLMEWFRKGGSLTETGDQETIDAASAPYRDPESGATARRVLEKLKPADRELLEEYFVDGSTAPELAVRWGLSPAGLRTRVFRLRAQLLRHLGQE
jgi:DNA-directed RNA polymerase specialized sigma24 family protein